jgi:hypothetical protein
MIITKPWLMQHRTKRKSWNAAQLKLLGVAWQPPKNWIQSIIGNQITPEQAERFEMLAGDVAKKRN